MRGYRERNAEKLRKYFRDYYSKNRERCLMWVKIRTDPVAKAMYDKKYRSENKVRLSKAARLLKQRGLGTAKALWNRAKGRCKKSGRIFTISVDDVVVPATCPVLGIELFGSAGRRGGTDNSPSLDRRDNSKGYEPGNVVVISRRANAIKHNATSAEVQKVADWMKANGL